jgi:hypothetical protein
MPFKMNACTRQWQIIGFLLAMHSHDGKATQPPGTFAEHSIKTRKINERNKYRNQQRKIDGQQHACTNPDGLKHCC